MSAFWELVRRDLLLAWKEGGTVGVALGFYLVVVTLLPLGIGPDLNLLTRIAPGVLWVALLLAALLSLGRMFETDWRTARWRCWRPGRCRSRRSPPPRASPTG